MTGKRYCRTMLLAALVLAACDDGRKDAGSIERPAERPASQASQSAVPDGAETSPPDRSPAAGDAISSAAPAPRKPLDLSLPPQPRVTQNADNADVDEQPLLPDLFEKQSGTDGGAVKLKGRLLVNDDPAAQPHSLDAIEGGQINLEMKTR